MQSAELAERYAQAIFSLADEQKQAVRVVDELKAVARLLDAVAELRACVFNPSMPVALKKAVVTELLKSRVSELTLNLVLLLITKRRERVLPAIIRRAFALLREQQGIVQVNVTSALPVEPLAQTKLTQQLAVLLKRQVELETSVDASLLGGIVIRIGNRLVDGSCRGQLDRMRDELVLS